jgi:predicted metal-dependent peptidase
MTPNLQDLTDKAEKKMATAYARLLFTQPFFAAILYRHKRVVDPACDTLWIDGRRIGYSPSWVLALTGDQLVGALAHEAMHVAGLHHIRRGARDNDAWNVACDHVVNYQVTQAGLALPEKALPGIADMTPEALYRAPAPPAPEPSGGKPEPGDGDGPGAAPTSGSDAPGNESGEAAGDGTGPEAFGEVRDLTNEDGTALSASERDDAEQEARIMIEQAVRAAARWGHLPGHLAHFAKAVTAPRLPWQEILARFIDSQARHDWSWSRPNLRYLSAGVMMPSLSSPAYGNVVLAIDTSGSMPNEVINQLCEEVRACLSAYAEQGQSPELNVLWCDTEVTAQVLDDEAAPLHPAGRGGTDFAPVFAHVEQEGLEPRGIVYATDGECGSFGIEPACPVLWILTKPSSFAPPFGEVVHYAERLA